MNKNHIDIGAKFDNTYAQQLNGYYSIIQGDDAPSAKLIKFNHSLASELGLCLDQLTTHDIAAVFSGDTPVKGATPLAQIYAGHQFANFNPQLGDGRALLLGEVINHNGDRQDIQLKGAGRTPYSRNGDGKAAIGPVLREYLMGEAMHALHIPTTRALAAVSTGHKIMREKPLPGAVLTRVASSHLRIGTFQYFAAQGDVDKIKQLADYTIQRHFPELSQSENPYLGLLCAVRDRQARLIAQWMLIGFVHGVMNTDNMTISGETIDYGPCAFMDTYKTSTVFSSIDTICRYAYNQQPVIAKWNLARFAETLLPLISSDTEQAVKLATDETFAFTKQYEIEWLNRIRAKLGLSNDENDDLTLANDLLDIMENEAVDFTQFFRELSGTQLGNLDGVNLLFNDASMFLQWHKRWQIRLTRDPMPQEIRSIAMDSVNPVYIPRNHKVEEALKAAEENDNYAPFEKLLSVLSHPFEKRDELSEYETPAHKNSPPYKTFCGT